MELDSFLASPRWEILSLISERPSSPIELAEKTKTTVSFISQQLKLLEAAQIVKKTKTGAYEKGKARNLFSISEDFLYLTIITNGFSAKKKVNLNYYKRSLLQSWLIENKSLQEFLGELLYSVKENLPEIQAILLDTSKISPQIIFFSEDKKAKQAVENFFKKSEEKISYKFYSLFGVQDSGLDLNSGHLSPIHQLDVFLKKKIELKGGKKDN
jgi:DNA-binding transcriptional regulator GbsR (MarR family)